MLVCAAVFLQFVIIQFESLKSEGVLQPFGKSCDILVYK